jgi:hypothetical protein
MVTVKVNVKAVVSLCLIAVEGKQLTTVANVMVGMGQNKMIENGVISSVLGCWI